MAARKAGVLHLISDSTVIAQGLCDGGFCLLRWELVSDNADLPHWKRCLEALCQEQDTGLEFIDIPRKNLTVVVNVAAVPPDHRVHDLIAAVDDARWRERHP